MSSSFLRITLRRLARERFYALINIAGLSLGIACCIILGLYLQSELTYDRHNLKYRQIYRIVDEFNANGKVDEFAVTSPVLGPMLAEEYPEIQDYVRLRRIPQKMLFHYEDAAYYWENVFVADDNIFEIFTHEIIYGDPATALTEPDTIAVSESFARTYFGDVNPIGRIITSDAGIPTRVALVFADLPANSHVHYDALVSYNRPDLAVPENITARRQSLFGVNDYTYLVLPENYTVDEFRKISNEFFTRHMEPGAAGCSRLRISI